MTTHYTHTRPETHRQQIVDALRRWPLSLCFARSFLSPESQSPRSISLTTNPAQGGAPCPIAWIRR